MSRKTGNTDIENNKTGHLRNMLLEDEETQIEELIAFDAAWKEMHDAIIGECNVIIAKPEVEKVMIGRRLQSISDLKPDHPRILILMKGEYCVIL